MASFTQGHALVVGVGTYQDSKYTVPITFNDAQGVYDALLNPNLCGYPNNQVKFLHDQAATRQNILDALNELAQRVQPSDSVMVFLAGHGAPAADGTWHFATHETEFNSIQSIQGGNSLGQTEFLDALRKIRAQKILVLINACFSGLVNPVLAAETPKFQTLGTPPPDELSTAVLGTGEGRAIITASRGNQYSMFDPNASRTFFGDAVVEGLNGNGVTNKNGYIGLFELYETVFNRIQTGISKYGAHQEPVLTILQGVGPFPVALYKGATPGNLAQAGLMTTPPPNTAAKVIKAGTGANVADITGSNNTVTQNTNVDNSRGSRNSVVIGANSNVRGVIAGDNNIQTINEGGSATELAKAFQTIYQQIAARPDDQDVAKDEISSKVKEIQAEAMKGGTEVNPNKIQRWLKNLGEIAPDILNTTATVLATTAGVANSVVDIAKLFVR